MVRLVSCLSSLVALAGCALGHPLNEGTYRISADGIYNDTCNLEYDADDIANEMVVLTWTDGETLKMEGETGNTTWTWDGDELYRTDSGIVEQVDSCSLVLDIEYIGTPKSKEKFWLTGYFAYSTEGDCTGVDTSGIPCSYEVDYTGKLVE